MMKNIIVGIVVIGVIIVLGFYYHPGKSEKQSYDPSLSSYQPSLRADEATLTPIDEDWNLYTSLELGISVKVPTHVLGAISCAIKNEKPTLTPGMIPVKVFEDAHSLYMGPEYSIALDGQNFSNVYTKCGDKIFFDPLTALKNYRPWDSFMPNFGLVVAPVMKTGVNNDRDLNQFIRETIDPTCKVGERRPDRDGDMIYLEDDTSVPSRRGCMMTSEVYLLTHNVSTGTVIWIPPVYQGFKDKFGNDLGWEIHGGVKFLDYSDELN